ncbi:hypothetical protein Tco_1198135, partial [Tanacetum coccineum]
PSPEHQPSSPRQESDIPQTQTPTHTYEAETWHLSVDDLFQLVPQLMTRIESLEKDLKQTKQTIGNAIVKLVKKVKKMEKVVKSRRVVLTNSEEEAAKNSSKQGRNLQKDESEVFETWKLSQSIVLSILQLHLQKDESGIYKNPDLPHLILLEFEHGKLSQSIVLSILQLHYF